jgi:hypothetical protein
MSAVADALNLRRYELELERRRAEVCSANGILAYKPHPKQRQFHEAASFHYRYARTGNRFGKSEMGAAEDVAYALGYRPWYSSSDPRRTLGIPSHPTKGLIITTDWDKSKSVFTNLIEGDSEYIAEGNRESGQSLGKLFKYIPKSSLHSTSPYTKNHSGYIDCIRVKHVSGGYSTIHLDTVKSFKQNPVGQESEAWDWIHIDEPIPEAMFKAAARGLVDRHGSAWFTCTPLTEPWIDNAFCPDLETQSKDATNFSSNGRWMMSGSMDDNPYNTPESIADFLSWLTPDEIECRRKGVPMSYAGIIYGEHFDYSLHVLREKPSGWKTWDSPPTDHTISFSIDYHFRKNNAVLFAATSPTGHIFFFHEIWAKLLVAEEVEAIKSIRGSNDSQVGLIDPLASTPNKVDDTTAMDEYLRHGLAVFPATKDPINGIRAVKALLKARDKQGRPICYFAPHLARTLFEISRGYVWDISGDDGKPVAENNDMMENLYRLTLQGLDYVEPNSVYDYDSIRSRDAFETTLDPSDFFADKKKEKAASQYALRYRS